jgi:hypothetical protein
MGKNGTAGLPFALQTLFSLLTRSTNSFKTASRNCPCRRCLEALRGAAHSGWGSETPAMHLPPLGRVHPTSARRGAQGLQGHLCPFGWGSCPVPSSYGAGLPDAAPRLQAPAPPSARDLAPPLRAPAPPPPRSSVTS